MDTLGAASPPPSPPATAVTEPSAHPSGLTDGLAVEAIPGKGQGVRATRRFARGETVLAEAALFTQGLRRTHASVLGALARCTPAQRAAFYALSPGGHAGRHPAALAVFETNVLPCGGNDAHGHVAARGGLFLLGARFNSSCVPNVNNHWDATRGLLVFRALRDVEPGEELCLAYGKLLATRDERRAEMRAKFGFECQCEACSLTGKALAESDARRECLGSIYASHLQGAYGDPMEGLGEVSSSVPPACAVNPRLKFLEGCACGADASRRTSAGV